MISPELLRRFPFFAPFSEAQLIEIAMIAEEENLLRLASQYMPRAQREQHLPRLVYVYQGKRIVEQKHCV